MHRVKRYLPDPEEPEYMINAVSVEIFRHFAETVLPPCKTVPRHAVPVIGRESPVLSQHGKIIGRSSGRRIHIEKFGSLPGIDTFSAYTDRDIPLEHYTVGMGILPRLMELTVQMELYKIVVVHLHATRGGKIFDTVGGINRHLFPFPMVGCMELIPQHTPCGIRFEPIFVSSHEIAILHGFGQFAVILGKNLSEILFLQL